MHCVCIYVFFMNHSSSKDSDLNSDPTGLEENTTMMSRQLITRHYLPTSPCYTTNYWAANDRIRFPNSVPHSRHRLVVAQWQILTLNPFIVICNSQTFRS